MELLSDKSWNVRLKDTTALGEIADPQAGEALLDVLADSFDKAWIEVEENAVWALEQLGEGVIEMLIEAVHNHKHFASKQQHRLLAKLLPKKTLKNSSLHCRMRGMSLYSK